MPIENRDLVVEGVRLVGRYKKATHHCVVAKDEGGDLTFNIGGKAFKSPSSAASYAMGGGSVNGWRFWGIEGAAPAAATPAPEAPTAADTAKAAKKAGRKPKTRKALTLFERVEAKDEDLEGSFRFWCNACMASFATEEPQPEACPAGHSAIDPELTAAPAPEAEQAEAEAAIA